MDDPSDPGYVEAREIELNELLLAGKAMEAFERFYAEDVVIQENTAPPVEGKEANRRREEAFLGAIDELESVQLIGWAVRGDVSYSEWVYEMAMANGRRIRMVEVAARRWRDGHVIHERYYHDTRL